MCGIVGVTGNNDATNILLDGLQQLEYRGYDSAGIYVNDQNGKATKERITFQNNIFCLSFLLGDAPATRPAELLSRTSGCF